MDKTELEGYESGIKMEDAFYQKLDLFLTKPPPMLKITPNNITIQNSVVTKSSLNPKTVVADAKAPFAQKKVLKALPNHSLSTEEQTSLPLRSKAKGSISIEEAFLYSEKLAKDLQRTEALQGIELEAPSHHHLSSATPSSASQQSTPELRSTSSVKNNLNRTPNSLQPQRRNSGLQQNGGSSIAGRSSQGKKTGGIVGRLRGTTVKESKLQEVFSVQTSKEVDLKKHALDFESLLRNFESGSTLAALKAELHQSQQSLANSEDHIRAMARDIAGFKKS